MALDIRFEDSRVLVINKPAGVVVHPAAGNHTRTLIQGILYHCHEIGQAFPDDALRPGIVHRLDKDTSGVIIAAKTPEAHDFLSDQFKRRAVSKKYYALVKGRMPNNRGTIKTKIARDRQHRKRFAVSTDHGKDAETRFRVLKNFEHYSFISLKPKTGRTHQLRVHMAHAGHPIVGDKIYSRKDNRLPLAPLMLHAYSLTIRTEEGGDPRIFRAPLSRQFRKTLRVFL